MKLSKNLIIWSSISIIIVVLVVISLYFLDGKYDYNGDILALGQLIFDIILLPVVFIGFVLTLNELKAHFSKPDLVFGLLINDELETINTIELTASDNSPLYCRDKFAIMNKGEYIPSNYMVRISIPDKDYYHKGALHKLVNYEINGGFWKTKKVKGQTIVEFRDCGNNPLFPNYPVNFGHFGFDFTNRIIELNGDVLEIDYLIYCDNFKPKAGKIKINIKIKRSIEN